MNGTGNAIQVDSYSTNFGFPYFSGEQTTNDRYQSQLEAWKGRNATRSDYDKGQQTSPRSYWPYTPIPLDRRFNDDTASPLSANNKDFDDSSVMGIDTLPAQQSNTAYTGTQGLLAVQRLATGSVPWATTVSFENPHPPYLAPESYVSYYMDHVDDILTPLNFDNQLDNKFYAKQQDKMRAQGFGSAKKVQQWTAIYYAMIEQVDAWIGKILDLLDDVGQANTTLGE